MNRILTLLTACVVTIPAMSAELATGYKCLAGQKPEGLFKKLIEAKVIEENPFENSDGIPSHAARPGVTAFGLPLVSISGWQPDTRYFLRAPGTAPTTHYTFVVRANAWELKSAANAKGIHPATKKEYGNFPYIDIRAFNSEYQETLPKGADPRFSYTAITCQVGI